MKITTLKAADTWAIRQAILWTDYPLDFVKLEEDELGIHWGIKEGALLVSVISFFITDTTIQFRKLATLPDYRNKGYAGHLIKAIIDYAKSHHITTVWCNSRADKTTFYEHLNFKASSGIFEKNGQLYVRMEYKL